MTNPLFFKVAVKGMYLSDYESRSEDYKNGWEAYESELYNEVDKLEDWFANFPEEIQPRLLPLLGEEITVSDFQGEPHMIVSCNDLFYWACADYEEFTIEDLPDLEKALQDCPKHGNILWICRKRKMRPQTPYYQFFTTEEKLLFDICGEERDD